MIMKKSIKRISAVAMAMALAVVSAVPAFAEESAEFTGQIQSSDLDIDMDLPANGSLTIKPYAGTQIKTTDPLYFVNNNAEATKAGADIINYTVGLAGYTCVATSATSSSAVKVATTLDGAGKNKVITADIQLGKAVAATTASVDTFKEDFEVDKTVAVTKLSTTSYDGTAGSTYTKNESAEKVTIAPTEIVPFRIVGKMNTDATWEVGDSITIVPVFSIGVDVTTKE
jgi:hypothetical protein